jgi:hypothetical protein
MIKNETTVEVICDSSGESLRLHCTYREAQELQVL